MFDLIRKQFSEILKWILVIMGGYLGIQLLNQYDKLLTWIYDILTALKPFFLAFLFAYLLHPLVRQFEKRNQSRQKSVLWTYLLILVTLIFFGSVLGPRIYHNAVELARQLPSYVTDITKWVDSWKTDFGFLNLNLLESIQQQLLSIVPKAIEWFTSSISEVVDFTMNVMTMTGNVILAFFISIYVLLSKEQFLFMAQRISQFIIGEKRTQFIRQTISLLHLNIGHYLLGKLLCSAFVGGCASLSVLVLGGKYAILLGLIYGLSNMIPVFGPIVGTIILVVIQLFHNPLIALILLILLFVIQQIETLILDPKLAGKKIGLTPFFTILGVILGGAMAGPIGMILGVPFVGVLKTYLSPWFQDHQVCESEQNEI